MTAFLATAAIEAGTASYRFSWAAPSQLVSAEGEVENLSGLVDAALADEAALSDLEKWLRIHKVGRDVALGDDQGPDMKHDSSGGVGESPPEDLAEAPTKDPTKDHQPILVRQKVH